MNIDKELETMRDEFHLMYVRKDKDDRFIELVYPSFVMDFIEKHIRRLLKEQRMEIVRELKDIVKDCIYEMEFEVVNGYFVPNDDKSWPRWNEERKHQLDKIDTLITKLEQGEEK